MLHVPAYLHETYSQESTRVLEHPGFVMRLVLDGDVIKFEPNFRDFEIVLINVYDVMLKAVTIVPRVETKLYSDGVSLVAINDDPGFKLQRDEVKGFLYQITYASDFYNIELRIYHITYGSNYQRIGFSSKFLVCMLRHDRLVG